MIELASRRSTGDCNMQTMNSVITLPAFSHEPLVYPTRMRVSTDYSERKTYELYAYPTPRPAETLLYLHTGIPAIVTYVLGPAWRDELTARQIVTVPQTNWTTHAEHDMALRLLRGGGAIIDISFANGQWWIFDEGLGINWLHAEQQKKYIFGWPKDGGVWVLHLPPLLEKHHNGRINFEDEIDQIDNWDSMEHTVFRDSDGSVYYGDLAKSTTMDDLCNQLKSAGAIYYAEIRDSPEVIDSQLLDASAALQKKPI
jgi:hypothetical protein